MRLELITLTGPKYEADAYEVMLPTVQGNIAVLPGHMPLVTLVTGGVLGVRRHKGDDAIEYYAINGGIAEIGGNKVSLLVDEADHADELITSEVRQALEAAQAAKAKAKDQLELDKAQAMVDRQTVRLKVAELRRHHRERSPEINSDRL